MPTINPSIPQPGQLLKASTVTPFMNDVKTLVNGQLDTANIASKYVVSNVSLTIDDVVDEGYFTFGGNVGSFVVSGFQVQSNASADIELFTWLKADPTTTAAISGSGVSVTSGITIVDLVATTIPSTYGIGVRLSSGSLTSGDRITANVNVNALLLKSSQL